MEENEENTLDINDYHSNTNEELKTKLNFLYINFANIFNHNECNNDLYSYLKSKSIPSNRICGKIVMGGGWFCLDCQKDGTCVMCPDCFKNSKEKHQDHKISFSNTISGCCDCGDDDAWNTEGFCSEHKGNFDSDDDINEYINKVFLKEQITTIKDVLFQLLTLIHKIITEEKITSVNCNSDIYNFLIFLKSICKANEAILHILSDLLIMNFPYETTHQCIKLTLTSIELIPLTNDCSNNNQVTHQCSCSFIQILFSIIDEEEHQSFLFLLNHNYKTKIFMGFSLFATYKQSQLNQSEAIISFSVQVIRSKIIKIVLTSDDIIIHFSNVIYELSNYYLNKKEYEELDHFFYRVFSDITYLLKPDTYTLFTNHIHFYKRMIDILCLMHNIISVNKTTEKTYENYDNIMDLIECEFDILKLFSLVITIFDFTKGDKVNELFSYFFTKFNDKAYQQLNSDEYSFHITLYRGFSIFLNQYIFVNSIINKIDLKTSLNNILEVREFNYESIIQEIYKCFGFIVSSSIENLMNDNTNQSEYFNNYQYIAFIKDCDFILIKLLCSTDKYNHLLSIDSLFKYTNINGSYEKLSSLTEHNIDKSKCKFDKNSVYLIFGKKIIDLIITILRTNRYMLNLYYCSFKGLFLSRVICPYYPLFNDLEKEALVSMIQSDLANNVIGKGNSCVYSDLERCMTEYYMVYIDEKNENEIIQIVLEKNSNYMLSLKPQFYDLIDLSFLDTSTNVSNAERYLIEFKKKEINLLQTAQIPLLNIGKNLQWDFENNFFSKENIEWLLMFSIGQLTDNDWEYVKRHYLLSTLKMIHILISIQHKENLVIGNSIGLFKDKLKELVLVLDKPNIENDEMQVALCNYTAETIRKNLGLKSSCKNDNDSKCGDNDISQSNKGINKVKKAELMLKYKKQFQDKNKQFQETIGEDSKGIETSILNEQESEISCVICRTSVNKDTYYTNPIAYFGFMIKDNFILNIYLQLFNNKFKMNNKDLPFEMLNESILAIKKQIRIVTCNHFIHLSCYDKFLLNNYKSSIDKLLFCPFCKMTFNIIIPSLTLKQTNDYAKGISLQEFFTVMNTNDFNNLIQVSDQGKENWYDAIEGFLHNIILIEENCSIDIDCNDIKRTYENYLDYFKYFFIYYDNYTHYQIDIMNTFIVSLRLYVMKKEINRQFIFEKFKKIINTITEGTRLSINKIHIGDTIIETLFLYLIMFDHSESKDNEINLDLLLRMFIPFIYTELYLKIQFTNNNYKLITKTIQESFTLSKFESYISQSKSQETINSLFSWYLNKFAIVKQILQKNNTSEKSNKSTNNINNSLIEKYNLDRKELDLKDKQMTSLLFSTIIYPSYWPKVLNYKEIIQRIFDVLNEESNKLPLIISPFLLFIDMNTTFNTIPLPKDMLQFATFISNLSCGYCEDKSSSSFICLVCGEKICNSVNCSNKMIIKHTDQCGGGNGIYIKSTDGKIIYYYNNQKIQNKYFVYLNQFGEEPKTNLLSKEYQLSQVDLDKAKYSFISLSYINKNNHNYYY